MNWLLKIVDGPMKGAEIALLGGRRTSVGSDDACDLVIADQSLAAKAFELDVSDTAVTVLVEGGEAKVLHPFEVRSFGTTAIAVGPAEGAWQPLVYPKPEEVETKGVGEEGVGQEGEKAEAETEAEGKADGEAEGEAEKPPKRRRKGCGCLLGLILLALVIFLLWFFWGRIVDRWPVAETYRAKAVETVKGWWHAGKRLVVKPEPVVVKGPTLEEIAATYALAYTPADGEKAPARLSGNVTLRTERLAIRALALADDPTVKLDLTDDESLLTSANELLFAATEGSLKASAASNRVVTVTGFAPSAEKLESVIRALSADVPAVERLDTSSVRVGGTPPAEVAETSFAETKPEPKAAPRAKKIAPSKPDYPIAGLLTKPYPCVVMRDGHRLCAGAQIGTAEIVRIETDRLVLKDGDREFDWKP